MTRLGYQIPNFTYPGVAPADIFGNVVAQAKAAEAAGYDRVFVMDHFYQLPGIGAPEEPMFECYGMLSALAQHTERVRLSALVTGNTYRNPALLAKTVTTLDHVSNGRATLGIGRVRNLHGPLREARGGAADHRSHAARRATHALGQALPGE
jgi:alkanesulfonate monooxygenase SsuD/methylene tetrahydromethanopterin reductase-like flavin-dependent oxidoreductase (luciferase family)